MYLDYIDIKTDFTILQHHNIIYIYKTEFYNAQMKTNRARLVEKYIDKVNNGLPLHHVKKELLYQNVEAEEASVIFRLVDSAITRKQLSNVESSRKRNYFIVGIILLALGIFVFIVGLQVESYKICIAGAFKMSSGLGLMFYTRNIH